MPSGWNGNLAPCPYLCVRAVGHCPLPSGLCRAANGSSADGEAPDLDKIRRIGVDSAEKRGVKATELDEPALLVGRARHGRTRASIRAGRRTADGTVGSS